MTLKRQLAGKRANVEGIEEVVAVAGDRTPTLTPNTTPTPTPKANPESNSNEPKRGRGRPKKNTTVTSIICETRHMLAQTPKDPIAAEESGMSQFDNKSPPISIYGYNNMGTNIGRTEQSNMNPIYVIEGDELFIRDDNGMLYDIESRDVIGWYNPYASGCSINWLYR